ncbi:MAG: TIGR02300 family protein [Devosiaceae bacterium]|nr:TIGR02300 family protein [Devosiaceae bacterium]
MASDKRGTKHQCLNCGMKYYDLNRDPILCPGCQTPFETPAVPEPTPSKTPAAEEAKPEDKISTESVEADPGAKVAGAEVVSFEDAESEDDQDDDEENSAEGIPDVEGVEDIGGEVDNAFVESDDDEDEKVDFGVNTAKDDE